MENQAFDKTRWMRRISFETHDTDSGPRIGGHAPLGMEGQFRDEHVQYFGTFPLSNGQEFSIFHRFEIFGDDEQRDVIGFNNQILRPSEMIWSVVHDKLRRSRALPAAFPGISLKITDLELDNDVHDADLGDRPIVEDNKLFGRSYLQRHQVVEEVLELEASGSTQLLQIGVDFDVDADGFPWDPGCLNVWCIDASAEETYRFCVQQ